VAVPQPNIKKSAPPPGNPNQPEPKIIPNEPTETLKEALDRGEKQIRETQK
jgi:hypothetical protein